MEDKNYYIPVIEDFFSSYEYEIHDGYNWISRVFPTPYWEGLESGMGGFKTLQNILDQKGIRTAFLTKEQIEAEGFQFNEKETEQQWEDFIYHFQRYDGADDDPENGRHVSDGYKYYTEVIFRTNCNLLMIKKHHFGGFTGNQHYEYVVFQGIGKSINEFRRALKETSVIGSFKQPTK